MACSSRQNEIDTNFPGVVRLWKRSMEMKPSILARSDLSAAARSKYSWARPSAGQTSKMTANMAISPNRTMRYRNPAGNVSQQQGAHCIPHEPGQCSNTENIVREIQHGRSLSN